jgi:lysozyme
MRKPAPGKTPFRKSKKSSFLKSNGCLLSGLAILLLLLGIGFHYKNGLAYYLGFKSDKVAKLRTQVTKQEKRLMDIRNYQLLNKYEDKVIGFDVSHYQGEIEWKKVRFVENTPLQFVFIRATAGNDATDACFDYNWKESKRNGFIRGAYHYYRPNENSLEQAANFIKSVHLEKGDLPPVLDIEALPENQSIDSLKTGLRRWLKKIDAHYHVKPIIYTGEKYYDTFLRAEFSEYTFWIANYNFWVEDIKDDWLFWQFTDSATINGVPCAVDINIYNGTPKMLKYMTIN